MNSGNYEKNLSALHSTLYPSAGSAQAFTFFPKATPTSWHGERRWRTPEHLHVKVYSCTQTWTGALHCWFRKTVLLADNLRALGLNPVFVMSLLFVFPCYTHATVALSLQHRTCLTDLLEHDIFRGQGRIRLALQQVSFHCVLPISPDPGGREWRRNSRDN